MSADDQVGKGAERDISFNQEITVKMPVCITRGQSHTCAGWNCLGSRTSILDNTHECKTQSHAKQSTTQSFSIPASAWPGTRIHRTT